MNPRPSNSKQIAGGTLIEVLVSLVVITLIASTVLEVAAHRRRVVVDCRRTQAAFDLALLWQSAHLRGERWAIGDTGGFPGQNDERWVLESLPLPGVNGKNAPDGLWRRLDVIHLDVGREETDTFVFRLDHVALPEGS